MSLLRAPVLYLAVMAFSAPPAIRPQSATTRLGSSHALHVLILLIAFGLAPQTFAQQYPERTLNPLAFSQLPSSTQPPVIPPPVLTNGQTLNRYRTILAKTYVQRASQSQYRASGERMYDLKALSDFLGWGLELPNTPESKALLKARTRPLPEWSFLFGRVAQVNGRNGILLWSYDEPEMVENAKLVRLRNYPLENKLVDGDTLIVFARHEGPYSYVDSQRTKSTIHSYDFGKVVTKAEVDRFILRQNPNRPLHPVMLAQRTNSPGPTVSTNR